MRSDSLVEIVGVSANEDGVKKTARKRTHTRRNQSKSVVVPLFTERLKSLMAQKDTQIEFATKIGVSRQTLGQYLIGSRLPSAEMLYTMCRALGVRSDWLIGLSDIQQPESAVKITPGEVLELARINSEVADMVRVLKGRLDEIADNDINLLKNAIGEDNVTIDDQ